MNNPMASSRSRSRRPPDVARRIGALTARLVQEQLAPEEIEEQLAGLRTEALLAVLVPVLDGSAQVRDAASAIVDAIAARPDGAAAILTAARSLPPGSPARIVLLAIVSDAPEMRLSPAENDDAMLGPIRLQARDAAVSAHAALELALRWSELDAPRRDALLAWF